MEGFPDPITCMSGNGCHALYRIDLPNTPESLTLVQGVLTSLHQRFSSDVATIDTAVANAARIIGLVGTTKMKGDPTDERPHRRSQLLSVPGTLLVVEEGKLRALADQVTTAASPPRAHGAIRAGKSEPPERHPRPPRPRLPSAPRRREGHHLVPPTALSLP